MIQEKNISQSNYDAKKKSRNSIKGSLLLLFPSFIWGSTFIIIKYQTQTIPPILFLGIRFLIALIGFLFLLPKMHALSKPQLLTAILAGFIQWVGYAFQYFGIQRTTATLSSFYSSLSPIIVPILGFIFLRQKIFRRNWISAILAIIGIIIFTLGKVFHFNLGDALVLSGCVIYSSYLLYRDKILRKETILSFVFVGIIVMCVCSWIYSFIFGDISCFRSPDNGKIFSLDNILIFIYMGLCATMFANLCSTTGQYLTSSNQVSLIYSSIPIIATVFAVFIGDEIITLQIILGGIFILSGIIFSIFSEKLT